MKNGLVEKWLVQKDIVTRFYGFKSVSGKSRAILLAVSNECSLVSSSPVPPSSKTHSYRNGSSPLSTWDVKVKTSLTDGLVLSTVIVTVGEQSGSWGDQPPMHTESILPHSCIVK
jgi:hypothetical protein